MKIALCNEVLAGMDFPAQCAHMAALGYDGIELAPYTVGGDQPHLLAAQARQALRRAAADHGLVFTSLHWLLVKPEGLSITSADKGTREKTIDVMRRLIGLAADLGAPVLVHGSPAQRRLPDNGAEEARRRGIDALAEAARAAEAAGVAYCIEALAPPAANFVTSMAEAAAIVREIGSPAFRAMIDASACAVNEAESLEAVVERWLPTGLIAHVQVNDRNRRGPGQGSDRFAPFFAALKRHGYAGHVAVEPFDYVPDGPAAAARAIGYVRGILEALP